MIASATSKKVSLKLQNGATYYGEVKNGQPHGKGTMKWGGSKSYSGDWVNGKRSGQGKYVVFKKTYNPADGPNGYDTESLVYIGQWSNDKQNGTGTLMIEGTIVPRDYYYSIYKGTFKNNQFEKGYSYNHSHYTEHDFNYSNGSETISVSIYRDSFPVNGGFSDYFDSYFEREATLNFKYKDAKGNKKEDEYMYAYDSNRVIDDNGEWYPPYPNLTIRKHSNGTLKEEYVAEVEAENMEASSEIEKFLKPHVNKFESIYKELHQWMQSE
ncbi:hypothetical protein J25TS5_14820 [Paenibacillus faecis]|uniref:hypothetical protein n=1 Tax=Paenibacillus faecis TaxID=862114 RepID=UPI001B2A599C|nr:hypothetical protein [Paenibacillus faecis]GIO84550.1 hypothetical protein J25TS5_14820 [Paenibacillus faecis]